MQRHFSSGLRAGTGGIRGSSTGKAQGKPGLETWSDGPDDSEEDEIGLIWLEVEGAAYQAPTLAAGLNAKQRFRPITTHELAISPPIL